MAHSRLPINTVFEVDATTLDRGPSLSLNVAESFLAAVKASKTLTTLKILLILQEIYIFFYMGNSELFVKITISRENVL